MGRGPAHLSGSAKGGASIKVQHHHPPECRAWRSEENKRGGKGKGGKEETKKGGGKSEGNSYKTRDLAWQIALWASCMLLHEVIKGGETGGKNRRGGIKEEKKRGKRGGGKRGGGDGKEDIQGGRIFFIHNGTNMSCALYMASRWVDFFLRNRSAAQQAGCKRTRKEKGKGERKERGGGDRAVRRRGRGGSLTSSCREGLNVRPNLGTEKGGGKKKGENEIERGGEERRTFERRFERTLTLHLIPSLLPHDLLPFLQASMRSVTEKEKAERKGEREEEKRELERENWDCELTGKPSHPALNSVLVLTFSHTTGFMRLPSDETVA